ncbi:hypothetical protein [Fluviicola sp.]|jgi:hypothetical protein|uniref:hypothetical protein n=1 Tax=Fluviicola sp. TaxID=1917219 RepID=UPI0028396531|nr:hypothetical protein [Fluviicola sp.]MDR0801071.1 hypothetical protein [Fluviicola sp.]
MQVSNTSFTVINQPDELIILHQTLSESSKQLQLLASVDFTGSGTDIIKRMVEHLDGNLDEDGTNGMKICVSCSMRQDFEHFKVL